MRIIDKEQWKRKAMYNRFVNHSDPTFSVTTRLDVTRFFSRCKNIETSFFTDFLYIVMRCLNDIDEMKTRIVDGDVVIYELVDPGFIVFKDDESIAPGRIPMTEDYPEFYNRIRNEIEYVKTHESVERMNMNQRNDIVYISCLPWMDFTSLRHPYNHCDKESVSIPRITWGKVVGDSEYRTMAFDVSAHHGLMDGYHVCKLIMNIQDALDDPGFFDGLV